jgi:hypothetical protein
MIKTLAMLAGLAAFMGASVACFGLFEDRRPSVQQSCEGLTGPAKVDCEARKADRPR